MQQANDPSAQRVAPLPNDEREAVDAVPGSASLSPWRLGWSAWKQVLVRVWTMAGFHNLNLLAAGVAFFTFLAITPLIAATVMIYGLIGDVETVERQMQTIVEVVPSDAASLIEDQLLGVVTANSSVTGLTLVVALFFAIYGGMRAASGLVAALNVINEEHETRNIVKVTGRAALLTLAAIGIAITGIVGGSVFAWLQVASTPLLGPMAELLIEVMTWIVAIALGSLGFAIIMRFGPDRTRAQWRWLAPGAVLATILFLVISFGFSLYVAFISDYNATYGSLSAVVVFLMWLFLSAYGILLGALLNAEAERQTFRDSTIGPDRPIGERGAVLADTTLLEGHSLEIEEKRRRRHARRLARQANEKMEASPREP